ncbi:MAG: rhodanese-like domain-containing protein [Myxococcota bacterium]|nr:rhodanese-like domain-containing protein [Myxococcota bacterium]
MKKLLRKVAVKVLNMEFDTQERAEQSFDKNDFDPTKIPKVVQGSGDTPGPNHKEDIGRPWVSAQLSGSVGPFLIDIRPPNETVAGMLPTAHLMSGDYIKSHKELLPPKTDRITIYDQTGELGSEEIAAWLREQGWTLARRLRGGYREWLEYNELVALPEQNEKSRLQIGDPITLEEDHGFVHKVLTSQEKISYEVWIEGRGMIGIISEEDVFS